VRFSPLSIPCVVVLLFAGALPAPANPTLAAASCASPRLHPSIVLSQPLPAFLGIHPRVVSTAIDSQGDVVWSVQGAPSAPARLYVYHPVSKATVMLRSSLANSTQRISNLAISPDWLVFATAIDQYQGADWRIVVRDRHTGRERVVATGVPGGVLSGLFSLDGNMLAWVQPLLKQTEIRTENLVTGKMRVLATIPTYNNLFSFIAADHGRVVWEWDHLQGHRPQSDVWLARETGGPVRHVTTDGKGAEPSISWPMVAYLNRYRFGNNAHVIVRNLISGRQWSIGGNEENDIPEVSGSLVVYLPYPDSLLGLYDLKASRGVKLTHVNQMTIDGVFAYHMYLAHGFMVSGSVPVPKYSWKEPHLRRYVVVIYKFPASDPLDSILACPSTR
jgi:hypothetical protein